MELTVAEVLTCTDSTMRAGEVQLAAAVAQVTEFPLEQEQEVVATAVSPVTLAASVVAAN